MKIRAKIAAWKSNAPWANMNGRRRVALAWILITPSAVTFILIGGALFHAAGYCCGSSKQDPVSNSQYQSGAVIAWLVLASGPVTWAVLRRRVLALVAAVVVIAAPPTLWLRWHSSQHEVFYPPSTGAYVSTELPARYSVFQAGHPIASPYSLTIKEDPKIGSAEIDVAENDNGSFPVCRWVASCTKISVTPKGRSIYPAVHGAFPAVGFALGSASIEIVQDGSHVLSDEELARFVDGFHKESVASIEARFPPEQRSP